MVSVCMATYNGATYLYDQIVSILTQLSDMDELIISDDGSTDGTLELLYSIEDPRIRLLHHRSTGLIADNFAHALMHARGEWIFLCDQDDLWYPQKVNTMLPLLQKHLLVLSDAHIIDTDGKILHPSLYALRPFRSGFWTNLLRNHYVGCTMAFHRCVLDRALPFPPALPMHDWWIGLIQERHGGSYFCPIPLMGYRRHTHNASQTSQTSATPWRQQWRWRLMMLQARGR